MKKLPLGIQTIGKILEGGSYVYVDKTPFILDLINDGAPYFFMSRPRRFGKSLFLNTLYEVFSGNKKLFKGCAICRSSYPFKKHPIVHLDFSKIANSTPDQLKVALKIRLELIAKEHKVAIVTSDVQVALDTLVVALAKKYHSQVVVLVDEYDKPIIDHLDDLTIANKNKEILRAFFGTLKGVDKDLRFTFVTGISKFSQVSLFSGLNNMKDLTIDPKYAGMMGYTEEELKHYFASHLETIAEERDESIEEILQEMRNWYNGYRFSKGELCVYNPFSTLNFFDKKETNPYWYSTGTPSFLIDHLKKYPQSAVSLDGTTARGDELMDISTLEEIDLGALMYQTGYFTIKDYNPKSQRYYLGLPNEEVRTAFMHSLVKNCAKIADVRSSEPFVKALDNHQMDNLFEHIKGGFASFAYQVFAGAKECTYQAMLLSMLYGMGFDPLAERSTNTGRIDVCLEMPQTTYILEIKLDQTAEAALKQIHQKEYFRPFLHKDKEIALIGASFSSKSRNIYDWKGELLSSQGEKIRDLSPQVEAYT
ncbi:MAG: AAA family ATPase [Chlamydiia bacterium]|nr:AAA family ATPase [Chlamydiia bacterium]